MCCDGQPFAERNAGDENIHFTDQQSTSLEVGPNVGGQYSGGMREGEYAMSLAELLKAGKLGRCSDRFQSTGIS